MAAIFLSAFAGNMYDRIGFQDTYLILGSIVLVVTILSAFTLTGKPMFGRMASSVAER
jgi:OHS family lactose permease-like MFS transporter